MFLFYDSQNAGSSAHTVLRRSAGYSYRFESGYGSLTFIVNNY